MDGIIVILGSPNDDEGNLSDISLGRLREGIEQYKKHQGYKILCTGGFGEHFNRTKTPHAKYALNYLISQKIPETDLLEIALSYDTVDDAYKAKLIIEKNKVRKLVIVSSDFHMGRVRHIFERILEGYELKFEAANTCFPEGLKKELISHEEREMRKLEIEGIPKEK